jgi:hypothetical protein
LVLLKYSTCVEVDRSGIKLSSIPIHSNTYGSKWIHMYPKKALAGKLFLSLSLSLSHLVSYLFKIAKRECAIPFI